jgi:hypothetical protein
MAWMKGRAAKSAVTEGLVAMPAASRIREQNALAMCLYPWRDVHGWKGIFQALYAGSQAGSAALEEARVLLPLPTSKISPDEVNEGLALARKAVERAPGALAPLQDLVVALWYTAQPPGRREAASLVVRIAGRPKEGENTLALGEDGSIHVTLRTYKTHKTYGDMHFNVGNEELVKRVRSLALMTRDAFFPHANAWPLFVKSSTGQPWPLAMVTARLKAVFGPGGTVNACRHLYATLHGAGLPQMLEDARRMGHDVGMHARYIVAL